MRYGISILLAILIASLLIQNTCPRGFAGKSTVTSGAACCARCALMKSCKPASYGIKPVVSPHAPSHLPMYVLDMPMTRPAFRLAAMATPRPCIQDTYKNAAPHELFRPPCA